MGALAACAPTAAPTGPASSPGSTSASPEPGASTSALTPPALPRQFPVTGSLLESDNARRVTAALHAVAGDLPALKLDVTVSSARLSVLDGQRRVLTYQWSDGVIDQATSDLQYLGQHTFDPDDFPLDAVAQMFDIADLLGVAGQLVYQVQDYRGQQVVQTVSSAPETTTVFFRSDATAVPVLGTMTAPDMLMGIHAVVDGAPAVLELGFSPVRGYWAVVDGADGTRVRTRKDGIPTFEAPAQAVGMDQRSAFDPTLFDPVVLARAIAERQRTPDEQCEVIVQVRAPLTTPSARIDCQGQVHFVAPDGSSLDDELGPA